MLTDSNYAPVAGALRVFADQNDKRTLLECNQVVVEIADSERQRWVNRKWFSPWTTLFSIDDDDVFVGGIETVMTGILLRNINPDIEPIKNVYINYQIPSAMFWRLRSGKNFCEMTVSPYLIKISQIIKDRVKTAIDVLTYMILIENVETNLMFEYTNNNQMEFNYFGCRIHIAYHGFYGNEPTFNNVDLTDRHTRLFEFFVQMKEEEYAERTVSSTIIWER